MMGTKKVGAPSSPRKGANAIVTKKWGECKEKNAFLLEKMEMNQTHAEFWLFSHMNS
jgi:mannose-6-phosphate isomerase class I